MRWQAPATRGHAAMSRCKPLLRAGNKEPSGKKRFQ